MAHIQYRPDIDGMRAIAVLSVIGFHAFPTAMPGGFVGVDVFFVISGYLITSILLQDAQVQGIRILGFYAKRVLRIFPALVLVLFACMVFGWHTLLGGEYRQLGQHIFSGALFASNLRLWLEVNYFDNAAASKPLLHLWSLGIEEQFYIFWPLLLGLFVRRRLLSPRLLLTLLLVSLTYSCIEVLRDPTASFYSPLSRAWELLAGGLLAYVSNSHAAALKNFRPSLAAGAGLALIAASIWGLQASYPFPGGLAIPAVLGTTLLIAAGPSARLNARVLSHPWMVGLGRVSYPLYLWHWPLLSFAAILLAGDPPWQVRIGLVAASLVLAVLTYQCLEKPIRRLPRKLAIASLLGGMLLLALLGRNIDQREGLADIRYRGMISLQPQAQKDFVDWDQSGLITEKSCDIPFQFPGRSYCVKKHPQQAPTAAIIGDSHAFHAYWGLAQMLDERGENLIGIGRGACVPLLDYAQGHDADGCQPHINQMLNYAATSSSIRKVFLVFRGRYLPNEADLVAATQFSDALERTFNRMREAGKQVYYFLPVVETAFDPRLCMGGLPFGRKPPQSCELSRSADAQRSALLRKQVQMVLARHPEVHAVDPNDYLCQGDTCPVVRDGHTMFKDENHLSYSGSLYLGQAMHKVIMD